MEQTDLDGAILIIGRGSASNIHLPDALASRQHAQLHVGKTVEIEDLGSSNGTRLDGIRLRPLVRTRLSLGAVATIGSTRLSLRPAIGRGPEDFDVVVIHPSRVELCARARHLERAHENLLIYGEAGEDLISYLVHRWSKSTSPGFVERSCAALSEAFLERLFSASSDPASFVFDLPGQLPRPLQIGLHGIVEGRAPCRIFHFVAASRNDLAAGDSVERELCDRLSGASIPARKPSLGARLAAAIRRLRPRNVRKIQRAIEVVVLAPRAITGQLVVLGQRGSSPHTKTTSPGKFVGTHAAVVDPST